MRFVHRRHTISLAFGNYFHHPLGPSSGTTQGKGVNASPHTMDPTEEELHNISDLETVADHYGRAPRSADGEVGEANEAGGTYCLSHVQFGTQQWPT